MIDLSYIFPAVVFKNTAFHQSVKNEFLGALDIIGVPAPCSLIPLYTDDTGLFYGSERTIFYSRRNGCAYENLNIPFQFRSCVSIRPVCIYDLIKRRKFSVNLKTVHRFRSLQ